MLSSLWSSLFTENNNNIENNNHTNLKTPPKDFQDRLYEIINQRYSSDKDEFDENHHNLNLIELVKLLQEAKQKNYDLNIHDEKGFTFLHHVIYRFNPQTEELGIKMMELLHQYGCDLNNAGLDRRHTLPIIPATRRGMIKTTEWLLKNGANPTLKDFDDKGQPYKSAIDYAHDGIKFQKQHNQDGKQNELISRLEKIEHLLLQSRDRTQMQAGPKS